MQREERDSLVVTPEPDRAAPDIRRLKTRTQFLAVAATRRRIASDGVVVQVRDRARGSEPDRSRHIGIGYTASKKVGNAVQRNRAKRRLRALAAELLPFQGLPGHDYVLIARAATVDLAFSELRQGLTHALGRLAKPPKDLPRAGDARPDGVKDPSTAPRGPGP